MEHCEKGLGISRKVYTISLPLGATINMDGSCVVLCVSALFMAKIFGVTGHASGDEYALYPATSESGVSVTLHRLRADLRAFLLERGFAV